MKAVTLRRLALIHSARVASETRDVTVLFGVIFVVTMAFWLFVFVLVLRELLE